MLQLITPVSILLWKPFLATIRQEVGEDLKVPAVLF